MTVFEVVGASAVSCKAVTEGIVGLRRRRRRRDLVANAGTAGPGDCDQRRFQSRRWRNQSLIATTVRYQIFLRVYLWDWR